MNQAQLEATVVRLIEEGKQVLSTRQYINYASTIVDPTAFAKWLAGCRNLLRLLGNYAAPWGEPFEQNTDYYNHHRASSMQSFLEAILEAVQHGLLVELRDLVRAEAFDDLLGQAGYLMSEGYALAAGTIGRGVLEAHLRAWCHTAGCFPSRAKPTLSDFSQELYKATKFNVAVLQHVNAMAAIGNAAAHNTAAFCTEDVARLLRDLREFLGKYPVTT